MDIDLVYLWVNGNDPVWREKYHKYVGKPVEGSSTNCVGRYADNDELMFSLRSIEKYAPWIHRIFIVTDNQVPAWLDTSNPKIRIIDHREIMPAEILPCFNSAVLEHFFHKIPELSEHFLYANDDLFLNRTVSPETFFARDGLPIVRVNLRLFRKLHIFIKTRLQGRKLSNYRQTIHNAARLVEDKFGTYYSSKTHHNIDAYLKSDYQQTREMFKTALDAVAFHRVRSDEDIQRNLYAFVARAQHRAHIHYVTQRTSFRLHIHNHLLYRKFERYAPTFFCMNDSEYANDNDRRLAREFLAKRFPDKSSFEKQ